MPPYNAASDADLPSNSQVTIAASAVVIVWATHNAQAGETPRKSISSPFPVGIGRAASVKSANAAAPVFNE